MAVVLRLLLAALLLGSAALKFAWPGSATGSQATLYAAVAICEVLIGIGLLVRRTRSLSLLAASTLFLSFVALSLGQIASSGVGILAQRCDCLGRALSPNRGTMLIVAGSGLALASWLASRHTGQREGGALGRASTALGLVAAVAAFALGWGGVLLSSVSVPRQEQEGAAPPAEQSPAATQPTPMLVGRRVEPNREPVRAPAETGVPPALVVFVRESGSARPITGVQVWIPGSSERAITDESGQARLTVGSEAPFDVLGITPQGVWLRTAVERDQTTAVLELAPDVRLAGRVTWIDGAPAAGLKLRVHGVGYDAPQDAGLVAPAWNQRRVVLDTLTDEAGKFEIAGLHEQSVAISSADELAVLAPAGGIPGHTGMLWTQLPATDLRLRALAGRPATLALVTEASGDPVSGGGLDIAFDWGSGHEDYARVQDLNTRTGRVAFTWPIRGGTPVARLSGSASAQGYTARTFELEYQPDRLAFVVAMSTDASCSLRVLHPWGSSTSARVPTFAVYCDDRTVMLASIGRPLQQAAEVAGSWVFAGLPPGRCSVQCNGVEIAAADLPIGGSVTTQARLDAFSRVVLRPKRDGRPLSGRVRLVTRGIVPLQAADLDLSPEGTLEVFPVPVGKLSVTISRSTEVSDPKNLEVEVPGNGETIAIDVVMIPRR